MPFHHKHDAIFRSPARTSENSSSAKFMNKARRGGGHRPRTVEERRSRNSLSGQDGEEAPGARLSEETPEARECAGEALLGYMTLQFFGFGSSIRVPSSVVFVGMMNAT
jgi:hypothetical protein